MTNQTPDNSDSARYKRSIEFENETILEYYERSKRSVHTNVRMPVLYPMHYSVRSGIGYGSRCIYLNTKSNFDVSEAPCAARKAFVCQLEPLKCKMVGLLSIVNALISI